jgi:hypothetical protein
LLGGGGTVVLLPLVLLVRLLLVALLGGEVLLLLVLLLGVDVVLLAQVGLFARVRVGGRDDELVDFEGVGVLGGGRAYTEVVAFREIDLER